MDFRWGEPDIKNQGNRHRKSRLPSRGPNILNMILFNKSVGNFQYDHISTTTNDSKHIID